MPMELFDPLHLLILGDPRFGKVWTECFQEAAGGYLFVVHVTKGAEGLRCLNEVEIDLIVLPDHNEAKLGLAPLRIQAEKRAIPVVTAGEATPDPKKWIPTGSMDVIGREDSSPAVLGRVLRGALALRRARKNLRRCGSRYQAVLDNTASGLIALTGGGAIEAMNPAAAKMFEVDPETVIGEAIGVLIPGFSAAVAKGLPKKDPSKQLRGEVEMEGLRRDDIPFPLDVSIREIKFDGEKSRLLILGDLSERNKAREVAQKRDQQLQLLWNAVEQSADAVIITDPDAIIEYVNPAFTRNTGYSSDEAVGQNPNILQSGYHPKSFYESMWATLRRGEIWRGIFTNRRRDGSLYREEAVISPVRDELGRIHHFVAQKHDLSEREVLEAQLMQAQKMETVGLLAGGIAHDFNNLLTGVFGFTELLLMSDSLGEQEREWAKRIMEMGERGSALVTQLLSFSRKTPKTVAIFDLAETVKVTGALLQGTLLETVELVVATPGDPVWVQGDPNQIHQVLLNLAVNANDAMPKGGRLEIRLDRRGAGWARLRVIDNGEGIPQQHLGQLFDPFFTTKAPGKGTGLGLSVTYGIIQAHGGTIEVSSQVGRGTAFSILLPERNAKHLVPESQDPSHPLTAPPSGNGEVILLVDDDPAVVEVGKAFLVRLGYRVVGANSVREAWAYMRHNPTGIHLVVCDLIMPREGGKVLLDHLRSDHSTVPILFISGSEGAREQEEAIKAVADQPVFLKPLDWHTLAVKVGQILGHEA